MNIENMTDAQYGLLFDVRRSIRYHDRRRAFFEMLYRAAAVLVILLSGLALAGGAASWIICFSLIAALLAACNMANLHTMLRARFCDLEVALRKAREPDAFHDCQLHRLAIERDEPTIYRALDLYCYRELCAADGRPLPEAFPSLRGFHQLTSQLYPWPNIASR
jgi:hypothetical protein